MTNYNQLIEAKSFINNQLGSIDAKVGVILGSGLSEFATKLNDSKSIPFKDIPNFPRVTVQGHGAKLVFGKVNGCETIVLSGRTHYYEANDMSKVVFPVRLLKLLGIEKFIVTNAAGGVNKHLKAGDLVLIKDHINLFGTNPLIGENEIRFGDRFVNMSDAYDANLQEITLGIAKSLNIKLKQGVYAGLTGPSYETPAEVKMLERIGADVVGMSTVPEVIAARHVNLKVLGFSMVANVSLAEEKEALSHELVLEVCKKSAENLNKLLNDVIPKV